MEDYVHLLRREIGATRQQFEAWVGQNAARARGRRKPLLSSVYFGGGTPSLLPPGLLAEVVRSLDDSFGILDTAEISLEVDPGTFDARKLAGFLGTGVNRVSLGVQSFQESLLRGCGRAHSLADVYQAIETVQGSGLKNWSLDLISSLPHQTTADWEQSLKEAVASGAPHISVYDLQVEEGTAFGRWYSAGESPLPSDETAAQMYRLASGALRGAGYEHYEISSYAQNGFSSAHNMVYWHMKPYLAFGLSGASYVAGVRHTRPRSLQRYTEWVQALEQGQLDLFRAAEGAGDGPKDTNDQGSAGRTDRLMEHVMLRLRLSAGLSLTELASEFGAAAADTVLSSLEPYLQSGHVEALWPGKGKREPTSGVIGQPAQVRLSDPEGFLVSNEILASVFASLD